MSRNSFSPRLECQGSFTAVLRFLSPFCAGGKEGSLFSFPLFRCSPLCSQGARGSKSDGLFIARRGRISGRKGGGDAARADRRRRHGRSRKRRKKERRLLSVKIITGGGGKGRGGEGASILRPSAGKRGESHPAHRDERGPFLPSTRSDTGERWRGPITEYCDRDDPRLELMAAGLQGGRGRKKKKKGSHM